MLTKFNNFKYLLSYNYNELVMIENSINFKFKNLLKKYLIALFFESVFIILIEFREKKLTKSFFKL